MPDFITKMQLIQKILQFILHKNAVKIENKSLDEIGFSQDNYFFPKDLIPLICERTNYEYQSH